MSGDEGGDPACWAHLFEDEPDEDQAVEPDEDADEAGGRSAQPVRSGGRAKRSSIDSAGPGTANR